MISDAQRESLRQFFGGYFHQDWDLEADSDDGVIALFLRLRDPALNLDELSRSIVTFVDDHPDDDKLAEALSKELWCDYYPQGFGISARAWLLGVAAKLARAKP